MFLSLKSWSRYYQHLLEPKWTPVKNPMRPHQTLNALNRLAMKSLNVGALLFTNTILGVPWYNYRTMGPKTLFNILILQAPILPKPSNTPYSNPYRPL